MTRVAFLGPAGTFTEEALLSEADLAGADLVSRTALPEVISAVEAGDADLGIVPIENSIEGSVLPTLDSMATGSELQVFAELTLDVAFTIVVRSGTSAADVGTVAAFPVASAQVRNWLAANLPKARLVPANSNAAAANDVAGGRADARRLAADDAGARRLDVRAREPHVDFPPLRLRGAQLGLRHLQAVAGGG